VLSLGRSYLESAFVLCLVPVVFSPASEKIIIINKLRNIPYQTKFLELVIDLDILPIVILGLFYVEASQN